MRKERQEGRKGEGRPSPWVRMPSIEREGERLVRGRGDKRKARCGGGGPGEERGGTVILKCAVSGCA